MTTEKQWQHTVTDCARLFGWQVQHHLPSVNRAGEWRTYSTSPGFPDLLLAHPVGDLLVAELKVGRNKPTEAQDTWLSLFRAAGVDAYVWYPADWGDVRRRLEARSSRADRLRQLPGTGP